MSSKKKQNKSGTETSLIRSSAAEYLTFVAASGNSETSVEIRYADENVWLTQKMLGLLYDVETHTINYHLKKVFADSELDENSVIQYFRITAADGKAYQTKHYSLQAISAVGEFSCSKFSNNCRRRQNGRIRFANPVRNRFVRLPQRGQLLQPEATPRVFESIIQSPERATYPRVQAA